MIQIPTKIKLTIRIYRKTRIFVSVLIYSLLASTLLT